MAKSIKQLRNGADKRAEMKNKDGSPIHYDQQDQIPVITKVSESADGYNVGDIVHWHEDPSQQNYNHSGIATGEVHGIAHGTKDTVYRVKRHDNDEYHQVYHHEIIHHYRPIKEETVPHNDLKVWRKHAKEAGGYVEDHGNHYEAWDINHRKIGHFDMTAGHGHIHDNRPMLLKRQAESFEMNESASREDFKKHFTPHKVNAITDSGHRFEKTVPGITIRDAKQKLRGQVYQAQPKFMDHINKLGLQTTWSDRHNGYVIHEEVVFEATSPEYLNWKEGIMTKHGKVTFKTKPQHTPEGWNYVTTAHKDDKPVDSYLHSHRAAVLAGKHGEEARQRALAREAVETLDELYPIFEEAGVFEHLSPSRKEEARSKAEYESHLAQSAAHAHVAKSAHKHARKAQRYLKLAIESRYGAGLPVNIADHNPQTCRACQHLSKSGRFKTLGDLNKHAQEYPHIHGSYATDTTGKKLKEDTLIEAADYVSKSKQAAKEMFQNGHRDGETYLAHNGYQVKHLQSDETPGGWIHKYHVTRLATGGTHNVHIHDSRGHEEGGKVTAHYIKEDTLIEAGSSKSNMKRKYLGKSRGRTKVGTKAHPIDVKPKITFKDPGAMGRAGTMKMPQPTASRGI